MALAQLLHQKCVYLLFCYYCLHDFKSWKWGTQAHAHACAHTSAHARTHTHAHAHRYSDDKSLFSSYSSFQRGKLANKNWESLYLTSLCLYYSPNQQTRQSYSETVIIIIGIQPLGRSGQRPELSQATGMALVRCILGKFLGFACHCFPPAL